MRHRFTAPFFAVLVLALAAFAGSALAGDGHGKGSGDSGKAAKPAKQDKQSSTSAGQPASGGDNSQGVKPSNTTKHDTYAKASSDQTKKYGNGQTAGQIATKSGHGDATLHGPGNSQPHKTAACPGGHEVDVHALKNKHDKCASSDQKQQPETKSEKSSLMVSFCDMETATAGKLETKSADKVLKHELNGTPEEARDIVPPFTLNGQTYSQLWDASGQAIFNAGCNPGQVAGVQATQTQSCGTTTQTVTEQVLVGVKHMIGPKGSGRYVLIHPSTHSAHYTGKHKDDIPVYETVTKTITVPVTNCPATPVTPATPAAALAPSTVTTTTTEQAAGAVAPATVTNAAAPVTPASTPASAGGVKGAVVALKPTKTKPAGGVLGTTTRLGGTIASTRLPFTGLPLWIFALVAAGLIGTGLVVRRGASNNT
jgi:hypothetical protein